MLYSLVGLLLLAGGGFTGYLPATESCAMEIESTRGVWTPGGSFVPYYGDLELTAYLTTLCRRAGRDRASWQPVAVVPVYAGEPLCFAEGSRIFISVSLLLRFHNEKEVARALAAQFPASYSRRRRGHRESLSACRFLASSRNLTFGKVWSTLKYRVARYQWRTRMRLRRRR